MFQKNSDDDYEKSEDEQDEDDEYDLKDSMIDQANYTHNESLMAIYRKSLKNAPNTKSYLNRELPPITADIFSQAISQTEPSQYVYDSFCVAEDEEIVYGNFFFFSISPYHYYKYFFFRKKK